MISDRKGRRSPLRACIFACASAVTGCSESTVEHRAAAWLVAQQAPDGAFRSDVYGILKPAWSTTAIGLYALSFVDREFLREHSRPIARALAFLQTGFGDDDSIGRGRSPVDYPCYTAAFHLLALARLRPDDWRETARRHVDYLRVAQCAEHRGFTPDDMAYGGFGFSGTTEDKPAGADLLNISTTSWVLAGLRTAGVEVGDPLFKRARPFVLRCRGTDGGFHFTPAPAHYASKAGQDTPDSGPRSYGTATADGLHALVHLGGSDLLVEVRDARAWLNAHFAIEPVPGFDSKTAEHERALRTYWLATAASNLFSPADRLERIARHLEATQRADGSWIGASGLMKEDDPMVATTLALIALGHCRAANTHR